MSTATTTTTSTWATNNPYRQLQLSSPSSKSFATTPLNTASSTSSSNGHARHEHQSPAPSKHSSLSSSKSSRSDNDTQEQVAKIQPKVSSALKYNTNNKEIFQTRSIAGPFCSAGIAFERTMDLSPPRDDEIMITIVKYYTSFRRSSLQENAPLPSRPRARGFLRRMSTRAKSHGGAEDEGYKFTAMKMPRYEYNRFFARDGDGKYVGTEVPEKEWGLEELVERYAQFQEMPLRSVPGADEFGEDYSGEAKRRALLEKESRES